jgi:hypothetical protein
MTIDRGQKIVGLADVCLIGTRAVPCSAPREAPRILPAADLTLKSVRNSHAIWGESPSSGRRPQRIRALTSVGPLMASPLKAKVCLILVTIRSLVHLMHREGQRAVDHRSTVRFARQTVAYRLDELDLASGAD